MFSFWCCCSRTLDIVTVIVLDFAGKVRLKKRQKKLNKEDKAVQKHEAVIFLLIACCNAAASGVCS